MKPCLSCGRVSTEALCGHCTGLVPEALVTLARHRRGPGLLALARYIDVQAEAAIERRKRREESAIETARIRLAANANAKAAKEAIADAKAEVEQQKQLFDAEKAKAVEKPKGWGMRWTSEEASREDE